MRLVNRIGLKLKESCAAHGPETAVDIYYDAIKAERFNREDLSLREMAVSFMGEGYEDKLDRYEAMKRAGLEEVQIRESADAVDASNFAAIGGQLLIDRVKEMYKLAAFTTDKLFSVENVGQNLSTYTQPWLSMVLHEPKAVNQLEEYPRTAFQHQTITFPAPEKFGQICAVTREMLRADKTRQAFEAAESVGTRTGLFVHKQKLRVIYGITNNHIFNGSALNTYLTAGSWVNSLTGFTLTNWNSFNTVEQLFNQMTDPVTGEPIDVGGLQMLVLPALKFTARRILNATEVRSGDITTGAGEQLVSPNPIDQDYTLYVERYARQLLINEGGLTAAQADTVIVIGDFKKAFVWREVWPLEVTRAAPNNLWEFTRDIALAVKASVFGVAGVRDPRYVVKAYNSAA